MKKLFGRNGVGRHLIWLVAAMLLSTVCWAAVLPAGVEAASTPGNGTREGQPGEQCGQNGQGAGGGQEVPDGASRPLVLVIESYHAEFQWDKSYLAGIRAGLGDGVDLHSFQMDTKRLPREQFLDQAEAAFAFYHELKPDLVILGDDNAAALLGSRLVGEGVPVVYLGVTGNPRGYGLYGAPNVLGVLERPLVKRSVLLLSELRPGFRKVLALFDASTTAAAVMADLLDGEEHFYVENAECRIHLVASYHEWQEMVLHSAEEGYDAILLGTYFTLHAQDGDVVADEAVMSWMHAHSPVPYFALWDFSIGAGKAAGGFVMRGEEQGRAAASLARALLEGDQGGAVPQATQPVLVFSKKEMARWGIVPDPKTQERMLWVE